jgi:dTDP-4-amino-4,6-dideoxygalactose transaminase
MDPADAERRITSRTGAIIVVHHSGLAADMDRFLEIGRRFRIPIIEDCAQAYLCEYKGKMVGTMGLINAFSLNHFKHITCGSGGMILTREDRLHYYSSLFLDKCYQRQEGKRDPFFLAPNYQMTELQGAVALAQIQKLRQIVDRRRHHGERLTQQLEEIPGIAVQRVPSDCKPSYFMYLFRLKLEALTCNVDEFSSALNAEGIPNAARRITGGMVEYAYRIFQNRSAYPKSMVPFVCDETGANRKYSIGDCPNAERAFDEWITLDMSEHYSDRDIDEIAYGIRKVAEFYWKGSR